MKIQHYICIISAVRNITKNEKKIINIIKLKQISNEFKSFIIDIF